MKKIWELLKLKQVEGSVGIEIETEGRNLVPIDTALWRTEDDGSLRGHFPDQRAEYVLRKPININKVEDALDELINEQKDAKLNFSFRCSVHVHINVSNLTYHQFLAFLYLTILLEEPLMNMCGEERKANRFCLRIADAEAYIPYLSGLFTHGPEFFKRFDASNVRYSAINIASVKKYGSLEFRGMRGTMDKEVIVPWVQTLYRLREYAKKLGDPLAVQEMYTKLSNYEFAKRCLGVNHKHFHAEQCEDGMNRSYSLSIDLPYAYKAYEEKPEEPKVEKKVDINKFMAEPRIEARMNWADAVGGIAEMQGVRMDRVMFDELVFNVGVQAVNAPPVQVNRDEAGIFWRLNPNEEVNPRIDEME